MRLTPRAAARVLLALARSRRYKPVQGAADAHLEAFLALAKKSFAKGRAKLSGLKRALREEDTEAVLTAVDAAITATAKAFNSALPAMLLDVMAASADARVATGRFAAPKIKDFSFDKTNERAVEWAKKHAAETIDGISETTRSEIRDLVEASFEEQFDVDELADKIGDLIGDDARAETIARTETMRASNQGQQELWAQAEDAGLLTGKEEQEWIVTPDDRLCPICEPMDGVTAPMGGSFRLNTGEVVDGPPAHPNCRCTIALSA